MSRDRSRRNDPARVRLSHFPFRSLDGFALGFLPLPGFWMTDKQGPDRRGLIVLPGGGGKNQEPDRMQISETAEEQFMNYFGAKGVKMEQVREAIRKWNSNADPKSMTEALMFEHFYTIQAKIFAQ